VPCLLQQVGGERTINTPAHGDKNRFHVKL
jgi:hypothetical protein